LRRQVEEAGRKENELLLRIADFERMVQELEDKNKRLVELLNSGMFKKAEDYKNRVISRLQNSAVTPNKYEGGRGQPSPMRLQQILSDEQRDKQRERDRLQRKAENLGMRQSIDTSMLG